MHNYLETHLNLAIKQTFLFPLPSNSSAADERRIKAPTKRKKRRKKILKKTIQSE